MLGYKETPPPPFEPTFDTDAIYRHDARGAKTQHPIWDSTRREWRIDAKPAPSRVDYSDSEQAQAIAAFLERQSDVQFAEDWLHLLDQKASCIEAYVRGVRDIIAQLMRPEEGEERKSHKMLGNDARWLFMGVGCGLPLMSAVRILPAAEIIANTAHRAFY